MTETTVNYDLAAVIAESVDSIKTKLATMSDVQLVELLNLEMAKADPRSTLAKAIEGVQVARVEERQRGEQEAAAAAAAKREEGLAGDADDVATGNVNGVVFTGEVTLAADVTAALQRLGIEPVTAPAEAAEKLNAIADRLDGGVFDQAEVDKLIADASALHDENVKKLQAQLDDAKLAEAKPVTKRAAKDRVMKLDDKAEPGTSVVFTGEGDRVETSLPQLDFDGLHFTDQDGGRLLTQKIDLPSTPARVEISHAWLVDEKGRASAVARIGMMPLAFGAGTGAQLAAGSLLFRPTAD